MESKVDQGPRGKILVQMGVRGRCFFARGITQIQSSKLLRGPNSNFDMKYGHNLAIGDAAWYRAADKCGI